MADSDYQKGCLPCTNCVATVPQDRYFAVEQFGKYNGILSPGLSWAGFDCCGMCVSLRSITSRVEQILVNVHTKTKDNVFVTVVVAVQLSVIPENIREAMYKLQNVTAQVESYVADVVRSQLPTMTLDEAFENKDHVSAEVQLKLTAEMKEYGFRIYKALVTELRPNNEVVSAMNEINKQRRLRDAAVMQAEAQKVTVVKAAEAQADAAQLQGEGIARQRRAIIEGLRDSITHGTADKLSADKISELLLVTQYFETLRDIAASSKAQTVFLPHGAGAVADIASQIRNGILQANAQQRM